MSNKTETPRVRVRRGTAREFSRVVAHLEEQIKALEERINLLEAVTFSASEKLKEESVPLEGPKDMRTPAASSKKKAT